MHPCLHPGQLCDYADWGATRTASGRSWKLRRNQLHYWGHLRSGKVAPPVQRQRAAICASASTKASAPAAAPTAPVTLPRPLRDATAVLTAASGSQVYVLGVSHVSRESCRQVEELIQRVKPEIVLVELCKDRVPLLVSPDEPPPSLWSGSLQAVTGLPSVPGWPNPDELLAGAGLRCRGGAPVSASEIEDDALALLATGLFASAMPAVSPPGPNAAPAFLVRGSSDLQTVAPAGQIEFVVKERVLPRLASLEVQLQEGDAAALAGGIERVKTAALQASAVGVPAVTCYLQARADLLALLPEAARGGAEVVFEGVESGNARAVVRQVPAGQRRSLTGLEGSAENSQGWGIQPFQRRAPKRSAQSVRIGANMQIDAAALASPPSSSSNGGGSPAAAAAASPPQTLWRRWTEGELRQGEAEASMSSAGSGNPLGELFATAITQAYGGFQAKAGRRVGIPPGAAWQAALRAAAASGVQQVLLGDRPASITARRLAGGIWGKCAPFLLGSLPAAAASAVLVVSSLDGPYAPLAAAAAAALPVAAAAGPIAAPLAEIARFSGLSAAEIEEVVRVKEPVQAASLDAPIIKLWGEDALLDWPGAMDPIIHERDVYMARALAAAANGAAQGLTPAFICTAGTGGEGAVLRYAMPQGGNPVVCPAGRGDGAYHGLPAGRTVVGVVGTAHVRGIIRAWAQAQANADLSPFV